MKSIWSPPSECFEISFPEGDVQRHGQIHRYPRVQQTRQQASAFAWQWRDGTPDQADERATFDYLETHQFEYQRSLPDSLMVRHSFLMPRAALLLVGTHVVQGVLDQGGFRFDHIGNIWLDGYSAQHGTLIFTLEPDQENSAAENSGRLAVALWLHAARDQDQDAINWMEAGQPPAWQATRINDQLYLIYAGGLADTVAGKAGNIELRLDGDSSNPISTQFAAFQVMRADQYELARTFAASPDTATQDFEIGFLGTANVPTEMHLSVVGSGRIDGLSVADRPDYSGHGYRRLTRGETTTMFASRGEGPDRKDAKTRDLAEYLIDSGLISLASAAPDGFAVSLAGITVANAPTRHQAAVNVNVVTTPMASLEELIGNTVDRSANNHPIRISDVKIVGNWRDAADGPEIGGDGSVVEQIYLHVADDAIKIPARGMRYRHTTVLQGDIGGVVNLGSYGYNRGVQGSVVDGIYIHRITQKRWWTRNGPVVQDDDRGAIITTRTGNFNFLGQGSNGLTDLHISRVFVPSLLIDDEQINSVARVSAIGVMGGHRTTRTVFVVHQSPLDAFDFGPIMMDNLHIEPAARTDSIVYIDPFARDRDGTVIPADPGIVRYRD